MAGGSSHTTPLVKHEPQLNDNLSIRLQYVQVMDGARNLDEHEDGSSILRLRAIYARRETSTFFENSEYFLVVVLT